ncbi:ParA family protein [Rhodococcus opacus]|uniref:ParA family protein n=1 Tax=Rhodococcus opacus TaxID=37919 RepID=UPI001CED43FC|nr:ParA family protein [Rhodococcus opacus]
MNLIDCPGDFGHLTISALVACADVLAAVMTGAMELEALMRIENCISEQVELLNPTARLNHILCGRVELGQVIDQQVLAALRETYPDQTMRTIIPKSVRVSESDSAEEPVVRWAPSSSAARAYRDAARELVERMSG